MPNSPTMTGNHPYRGLPPISYVVGGLEKHGKPQGRV
jgi:hypothetical protein